MSHSPLIHTRGLLGAAGLVAGVLALGCTGQVGGTSSGSMGAGAMPGAGGSGPGTGGGGPGTGGSSATGGAATTGGSAGMGTTGGAGGTTPTGGVGGTSGTGTTACVGTHLTTPKRVIRLTEYQLFNAYTALFGAEAAATITMNEAKPNILEREFPPISGELSVSEGMFSLYDRMAQSAMAYVVANAGTLTPCGQTPSDMACVQQYVLSLAEKAFRHPLTPEETAAITGQFWTEMQAAGTAPATTTVTDLLGYGVYGVLSSPSFIYRTEFGADINVDSELTPYEKATALSMFLTDAPPDADLLAAAAGNALGPQQIREQATRLLATPQARANLEIALMRYFQLTNTPNVILNADVTPGLTVTGGLLASIYHEGELFMRNVLWTGPLSNLLLSKQTWTSAMVAEQVYKVAPPTAVDADGFGLVELPADRSGLLTLSTFLTSGTRSTGPSPVTRGLAINGSIVCEINPPFPEVVDPVTGELGPDPEVEEAIAALAGASELERYVYRKETGKCNGCHAAFDAFGMVLTPYDAVGRSVTMDLEGRPIDATWTTAALPESIGGGMTTNAVETANAVVASGAMDRCIAMNFINFALTEVSKGGANNTDLGRGGQTASCAVQGVIDAYNATDKSFASLIREIAASDTLNVRSKGL